MHFTEPKIKPKHRNVWALVCFQVLYRYDEGQCLHVGSDDEPATIQALKDFAAAEGLSIEQEPRRHHEISLSDPRRTAPEKLRTVIRLPVQPKS